MTDRWKTPVTWFALFNLIGAPIVGRVLWSVMTHLHGSGATGAAVGLSLVGAVGILAANIGLTWWATQAGLPRLGQMVLWLITGATFVLTVGLGVFSPINLVIALLR